MTLTGLFSKVAIDRNGVEDPITTAENASTYAATVMYGSGTNTFEALVCPSMEQVEVGIRIAVTADGVDKYFSTTAKFPNGLESGYNYTINLEVGLDYVKVGNITVEPWVSVEGGDLVTE